MCHFVLLPCEGDHTRTVVAPVLKQLDSQGKTGCDIFLLLGDDADDATALCFFGVGQVEGGQDEGAGK